MNHLALKGTFAATYAPFTADGSVDEPAYRALCERLVEGVHNATHGRDRQVEVREN